MFTSSAINKSGKTAAPRAVARRRAPQKSAPTTTAPDAAPPTPPPTQDAPVSAGPSEVSEPVSTEPAHPTPGPSHEEARNAGLIDPQLTNDLPGHSHAREGSDHIQAAAGVSSQAPDAVEAGTQVQAEERSTRVAGVKRKRGTKAASQTTTAPSLVEPSRNADITTATPDIDIASTEQENATAAGDAPTEPGAAPADTNTTAAAQPADVADGEPSAPSIAHPRARGRRKDPVSGAYISTEGDPEHGGIEADAPTSTTQTKSRSKAPHKPRAVKRPKATSSGGSGQAQDGETGDAGNARDDSEHHEIDLVSTTMRSLVTRRPKGQTSEREKLMRKINWDEVKRRRREGSPAATAQQPTIDASRLTGAASSSRATHGIQTRIVNGQIVLDEASQHIDRQAQALLDAENMTVDENADLTKRVNAMSWINDKKRDPAERVSVFRVKNDPWDDEETDRFYEALRMFGTDFNIISKMFAPRTRRQIKLKFVREERLDAARVDAALSAIMPMDLGAYAMAAGFDAASFKDPEVVNRELELEKRSNRAEIDKKREEAAEAQRQRDIMDQHQAKEKEQRDRERQAQKELRKRGRLVGNGTF